MPNYSKALSLELNQLFEKVENQADEYIKAFSALNARIEEFDTKSKELDNYREFFTNNFTNLAAETKISVTNIIEELQEKLDKVIELHKEYDQIVSFKETLILLHNQMRMLITQNDIKQNEFRNKSEYELNNLIINSKNRLDREVKNVYAVTESKIDAKIKFLETQLLKSEQQILLYDDTTKKEISLLKSDINIIRNLFSSPDNKSNIYKNDVIKEMQDKIEKINLKNEQLFLDLTDARSLSLMVENINDDLKKNFQITQSNQSKINRLEQNSNSSSNTLNIISLVVAIIALILAIVL